MRSAFQSVCRLHDALARAGRLFSPVLLLVIRLVWGWQYHVTGAGKLKNLEGVTRYFTTLGVPAPHANAVFVSVTEAVGGLLLMLGLGTRFLLPIFIVEMLVAFDKGDHAAFVSIFSDYDAFTKAAPFLFLAAFLVLFAFGPGRFSLDALLFRRRESPSCAPSDRAAPAGSPQR